MAKSLAVNKRDTSSINRSWIYFSSLCARHSVTIRFYLFRNRYKSIYRNGINIGTEFSSFLTVTSDSGEIN